jgi:lipopolysaccharide transport system ATP-binding protein
MEDVSKTGRTVLFVSHNMVAVQNLCGRAIWLNDGEIMEDGQPGQVVSSYLEAFSSTSRTEQVWDDITSAPGGSKVRLHRVCARPENGTSLDSITTETSLAIEDISGDRSRILELGA